MTLHSLVKALLPLVPTRPSKQLSAEDLAIFKVFKEVLTCDNT